MYFKDAYIKSEIPAYKLIGLETYEEVNSAQLVIKPEHLNFAGVGLGGYTFIVGDAAMRMAANKIARALTGTVEIKYRKPTKAGDVLQSTATVERIEGKKIFIKTEVKNYSEDIVAEMTGIFIEIGY